MKIKKTYLVFLIIGSLFMISACGLIMENADTGDENGLEQLDEASSDKEEVFISKAELLLEQMTLREKIGQMLFIQPESLLSLSENGQIAESNADPVIEFSNQMAEVLEKYPPGGIVIFGGNIKSPSQLTELVSDIKQSSTIPLFMGIDEEGGMVARIANTPGFDVKKYKSMQEVGQSADPLKAKEAGVSIGLYLKDYGFNLNFAPVADVNTNPDNIVIGNRSFGNDPELVADMVAAGVEGLHSSGIMSCIKHFPGHGDTKDDTHSGFVSVEKTWEELKACELIPFKAGIDAKTDMIMISHITAENITSDKLPSSLSYEMIEGKLRKEMDYKGIIISDSMSMGAIANQYLSGEAAVLAIRAGTDIVLMPQNYTQAFESIYEALNRGEISESRIDESVLRILSLKGKYNILK
ncbi:glycoside hydrolase family 3 protein [Proteocatella sphenisci]|uniref:glycoside hydrolase family 3 protein n=1 Tax=Proteocatella sphenisci TaxID=181070 RepID=UPI00048D1E1A|nr:glycoside hydrolase family 3 protein [Proteocatella sphenisci]